MTKKEFKELADIHVYGRGDRRIVKLYFDWNNDLNVGSIGYKYCLRGYGCTKETILADGYDILIKGLTSALCWYDYHIAQTDQQRFKVSLTAF